MPQLRAPVSTLRADGSPRNWVVWVGPEGDRILVCTSDVIWVGALAIAKVSYDKWLRFVWPLLVGLLVVATGIVAIAAAA